MSSSLATSPPLAPAMTGEFETHITVECGAGELDRLARWTAERGLKFTHIVLARGRMPSQPMVTLGGSGTLPRHRADVAAVADELRAVGFRPVRMKIEAAPWNDGVPVTDAEAAAWERTGYFEHHVKVRLTPDGRVRLTELVTGHRAHVSWNARRTESSGREQRFVTQRCHRVGLRTAGRRLDGLTATLTAAGIEILSVEREFVVLDSNTAIDDGWIEEGMA